MNCRFQDDGWLSRSDPCSTAPLRESLLTGRIPASRSGRGCGSCRWGRGSRRGRRGGWRVGRTRTRSEGWVCEGWGLVVVEYEYRPSVW